MSSNPYPKGSIEKIYDQRSIKARLEAFFLDNIGKTVTREMIVEVARDPKTGKDPENWHQRLSELRTDSGYTILSGKDRTFLSVAEYVLVNNEKRATAGKRVLPTKATWSLVLEKANGKCQWTEGGHPCNLANGDIDPVGGGTVKLTPDHMQPHSINPNADPEDPTQWQALCGRHQVMKKNYWDSRTGKINTIAVMQSLPQKEKDKAYSFLKEYFGDE